MKGHKSWQRKNPPIGWTIREMGTNQVFEPPLVMKNISYKERE
jgi:hypothetical protein